MIISRKVISVRTPLNQTYLAAQLLQKINFDEMMLIVISFLLVFNSDNFISYLRLIRKTIA